MSPSNPIKLLFRSFAFVLLMVSAQTYADINASTDDHSVAVPTAWWLYNNVTAAQGSALLTQNGARLTSIKIHSIVSGQPRFILRMVKNSGAYAVPGWWWYYGLTFSDVGAKLTANNARLIDLEPYDAGGGIIRYAAIMVSNTGTAARAWSYLSGVTAAQISAQISASGHRLIDLDTYFVGTTKLYSAVFVANTGSDNKAWQWWINQTVAGISAKLSAFGGRIVDLDRQPDGTYNVIMVKNSGADNFAWWWRINFASAIDILNYANQLAARPIDVETYVDSLGQRRYNAVFIDNGNAATKRMRNVFGQSFIDSSGNPSRGIFEAYLKRVSSNVEINLNSSRSAETASSLKVLHLLHTLRTGDSLLSSFNYYDYISGTLTQRKNACPDPSKEIPANLRTDYNLQTGLQQMMAISDNRATRGVVLRYGFPAINLTADSIGMVGTQLRHNIGCAYYNLSTGLYTTSLRNDTTAADLAKVYEGVWTSNLLTGTARTSFFNLANPSTGVSPALQQIINEEATALGKLSIATHFGTLIKNYGKGGSYGTCLPDAAGNCGQKVNIRSGAGLIRIPIVTLGVVGYRDYVFGRLVSDVPVPCWADDPNIAGDQCPTATAYDATYNKASNELYREAIRSALQTW